MKWEEKSQHLNQFNLFLRRGGHKEGFRRTMTEHIIRYYSKILTSHQTEDNPMYRDKNTMEDKDDQN